MIIRPLAKLPRVSCSAKPTINPPAPRAAIIGPICTPSAASAMRMPTMNTTPPVVRRAKFSNRFEAPRWRDSDLAVIRPANLEITQKTNKIIKATTQRFTQSLPPSSRETQLVTSRRSLPVRGGVGRFTDVGHRVDELFRGLDVSPFRFQGVEDGPSAFGQRRLLGAQCNQLIFNSSPDSFSARAFSFSSVSQTSRILAISRSIQPRNSIPNSSFVSGRRITWRRSTGISASEAVIACGGGGSDSSWAATGDWTAKRPTMATSANRPHHAPAGVLIVILLMKGLALLVDGVISP